jgi:hypothetical protein
MRVKIWIVSLMLAGAAGLAPASASAVARTNGEPGDAASAKDVRLAQAREVEVYYDDLGRRVIVDAYSGQVIDVLPPARDHYRRRPWRDDFNGRDYENDQFGGLTPRQLRQRQKELAPDDTFDGSASREDWPVRGRPAPPVLTQPGAPRYEQTRPGVYEQAQPGLQARGEEFGDDPDEGGGALPDLSGPRGSDNKAFEGDAPGSGMLPEAARPQLSSPAPGNREPFVEGAPALGPIASSAAVARVQILLDRAGASPGVIDG